MAFFCCKSSLKICMTPSTPHPPFICRCFVSSKRNGVAQKAAGSIARSRNQAQHSVPSVTHWLQAGNIPLPLHSREDFLMSGGPVKVSPLLKGAALIRMFLFASAGNKVNIVSCIKRPRHTTDRLCHCSFMSNGTSPTHQQFSRWIWQLWRHRPAKCWVGIETACSF